MSFSDKKLYELLPAYYRVRDSEQGEPLKALIEVIARESGVVEADIAQMHENWFIETCAEWVVPYIGDLLRVRGMHAIIDADVFSQRAFVANTLSYRRRKGTAPVLEQLALDITGWRSHVVEFFELLGATQNVNHIRLHSLITPDLRRMNELDLLDTAFESSTHNVDVRRIATGLGKHNIPNIGLFLWRLQSYPMTGATARPAEGKPAGCYTFSPLGYDTHLFNLPQTEKEITHLSEEINVPGLLRRRPLYDELEARRQALIDGHTPDTTYFGRQPVFQVFVQDNGPETLTEIFPENILICDLSERDPPVPEGWLRPPPNKEYQPIDGGPIESHPILVAVDPERGRLAFPGGIIPKKVGVNYAYGFSGDVGGGPYDRQESISSVLTRKVTWQAGVAKEIQPVRDEKIFSRLDDAVKEWNKQPSGSVGVITILDNQTYKENLTGASRIKISEGSQLLVVAADWPEKDVPGGQPDEKERVTGQLTPDELRPHLLGDLEVVGTAVIDSLIGGELALDGLLVEGKLTVLNGNLGTLRVSHCTLVPGHQGLEVNSQNERLQIKLIRSICGPIKLTAAVSKLLAEESIVDNKNGSAVIADQSAVELQKCTIFGSVEAMTIEAGNCIFKDIVTIDRRQTGCIRFSYIPYESATPRRFRCQPDLAIKTQITDTEEGSDLSPTERDAIRNAIREWLFPSFTSNEYGHYAYGQLSRTCPLLIKTGAEDGSEMGVFNYLKQPQREANLLTALNEYLCLGLEAGVIYVT